MFSVLKRSNRSSQERLPMNQNESLSLPSRRSNLSFYLKLILLILIIYYLNILFGFKNYFWSEKSFENDYELKMLHIDVIKMEENPEEILGEPNNLLPIEYLIENEYLCGRSRNPETLLHPHVLILVKSFSQNLKERQAIRLTWAEKNRLKKKDIRLAFVLGTDTHNTSVENEAKTYGDIIQIDRTDHYYYSSYKMIMMLRWINDYCTTKSSRSPHTDLRKYVLFVDDDYYINIDSLLLYIYSIDQDPDLTTYERRTFITGELIERSHPRRSLNDRYYVSMKDYPYDIYPPYISSNCFLMTRYNARLFYIASKYIHLFHFDQIYLGLLAHSMSIHLIENNKLFPTSSSKKSFENNQTKILSRWKNIFQKKIPFTSEKNPICIGGYRAQKLINLWNDIHQTNLKF